MIKLAGIVTLYYPGIEIKENINSYLQELECLYVIDNTPNKNNQSLLPISEKICYLPNYENVGVATALNMGAKKALEEKYQWLLTMDQDSKFEKDSITKMITYLEHQDEKKIGLLSPWHVINTGIKKPKEEIDYPLEVMTSGNIINLKAYQDIGGYEDDYFIDSIDIEYCMKLRVHDYHIIRLNTVELKHDLGDIEVKYILGRKFVCSNHNYIRRYYMVRNTFYLCDRYQKNFKEYCHFLKRGLRGQLQNILVFEKDKYRKVKNMYRGYRDYKRGIKGKYPYID